MFNELEFKKYRFFSELIIDNALQIKNCWAKTLLQIFMKVENVLAKQ